MLLGLWTGIFLSNIFGPVASDDDDIVFQRKPGRYLGNYVIRSLKTESEFDCSYGCLNEPECASVNFKVAGENEGLCELNSKTLQESPDETRSDPEYVFLEIDTRVREDILLLFIKLVNIWKKTGKKFTRSANEAKTQLKLISTLRISEHTAS